jgi:hypothetical protein
MPDRLDPQWPQPRPPGPASSYRRFPEREPRRYPAQDLRKLARRVGPAEGSRFCRRSPPTTPHNRRKEQNRALLDAHPSQNLWILHGLLVFPDSVNDLLLAAQDIAKRPQRRRSPSPYSAWAVARPPSFQVRQRCHQERNGRPATDLASTLAAAHRTSAFLSERLLRPSTRLRIGG